MRIKKINFIKTRIILAITMLSMVLKVNGQSENYQNLPQFLYSDFNPGRIKMKAGKDLNLLLNYNMITEKMIFLQKEQVFDMLNQGTVDTIYMDGSKFIPYGKVFYEVFPMTRISFFIQHKGRILSPPKPAAYGGTSEVSSSTYITRIDLGAGIYNMKLEGDLRVKYDPMYWIRINENISSFVGEKQFLKIFPGKENDLKAFIKKNRLKFDRKEDLVKLCQYANGLVK
jgi:hypothetical protein